MKLLEYIFSVTNSEDKRHKIITVLGIKLKFKTLKKKIINDYNLQYENIENHLLNIEKKLSMKDDIWQIKNIKFYVPYYPIDFIQRHIVNTNTFFEEDILSDLNKYIPDNAVILDIGANIGNHTLYWGIQHKISKVYAFEPVIDTFSILKQNVEINNLNKKVALFNIGLSDKNTNATYKSYRRENIGDTHLTPGGGTSDMYLSRLDDINIEEDHIDFVKIDVEDMEIYALKGMVKTLSKFKPKYIFVEVSVDDKLNQVISILKSINYTKICDYPHRNYLFEYI